MITGTGQAAQEGHTAPHRASCALPRFNDKQTRITGKGEAR
jgi:hypothetical protein